MTAAWSLHTSPTEKADQSEQSFLFVPSATTLDDSSDGLQVLS